jgi:hypothetical protein
LQSERGKRQDLEQALAETREGIAEGNATDEVGRCKFEPVLQSPGVSG